MSIDTVVDQLANEQYRIELAKRVLTDPEFFRKVSMLLGNTVNLAEELLEEALHRYDDVPVEDLDFSVRTFNCLKKAGLNTLGEVASKTAAELLDPAIRNFGQRSLDEVVDRLGRYGLKLKEP